MAEQKEKKTFANCCSPRGGAGACGGAVYGFGLFGALYFYLSNAGSFGAVMLGIVKSIVWPGMMVYHLFKFLNM